MQSVNIPQGVTPIYLWGHIPLFGRETFELECRGLVGGWWGAGGHQTLRGLIPSIPASLGLSPFTMTLAVSCTEAGVGASGTISA